MSDSLVLTGVKSVSKHTGSEMLRLNPTKGGDSFQVKRWWVEGGNGTIYESATVFDVSGSIGGSSPKTVKLAIAASDESEIRIDHDGQHDFTFYNAHQISRAALFTDTFDLIEHYVFPSLSSGKIMTVTPPNAASRPTLIPPTFTGVTLTAADGTLTGKLGTNKLFLAAMVGTATDVTFSLASDFGNDSFESDVPGEFEAIWGTPAGTRTLTLSGYSPSIGGAGGTTHTVSLNIFAN